MISEPTDKSKPEIWEREETCNSFLSMREYCEEKMWLWGFANHKNHDFVAFCFQNCSGLLKFEAVWDSYNNLFEQFRMLFQLIPGGFSDSWEQLEFKLKKNNWDVGKDRKWFCSKTVWTSHGIFY